MPDTLESLSIQGYDEKGRFKMKIPSCYSEGFEKACALDAELARKYMVHTTVGDPAADALIEELATIEPAVAMGYVGAAMDKDEDGLVNAPQVLRDFFDDIESPPDWADFDSYMPGVKMFHRNSQLILAAFVGAVLIEGFATNISKSFFITGRLIDNGVKRLKQNNRHMVEIFMPGGLCRLGDGWKLSVRIRLVHAQMRLLLKHSEDWNIEAFGTPLSAAHLGFSLTAFSARLLRHMKKLGADYNDEERRSFLNIWRHSGYLMGIPETILFTNEDEALELFDIGYLCEPAPDSDSIAMANCLVNSAPLVAGINQPEERRDLAEYVYKVSRALIGDKLADELCYPRYSSFAVLPWFRIQGHYNRLIQKHLPKLARRNNFTDFTSMLEVSEFSDLGISYRLPDHVYAEDATPW